jgi:hypothetical protein
MQKVPVGAQQFAQACGISTSTLYRYLAKPPDSAKRQQIERVLTDLLHAARPPVDWSRVIRSREDANRHVFAILREVRSIEEDYRRRAARGRVITPAEGLTHLEHAFEPGRALITSTQVLGVLLDHMAAGFAVWTNAPDPVLRWVAPGHAHTGDLQRYDPEQDMGKVLWTLVAPASREAVRRAVRQIQEGQPEATIARVEWTLKDLPPIFTRWTVYPIRSDEGTLTDLLAVYYPLAPCTPRNRLCPLPTPLRSECCDVFDRTQTA